MTHQANGAQRDPLSLQRRVEAHIGALTMQVHALEDSLAAALADNRTVTERLVVADATIAELTAKLQNVNQPPKEGV